jgi:hypothetical protein
MRQIHKLLLFIISIVFELSRSADDGPYRWISKIQTECEVVALQTGTLLGDHYNSFDENTEWDMRQHGDYMTENLGFATSWIQTGTWKSNGLTNEKKSVAELQKVHIAVNL